MGSPGYAFSSMAWAVIADVDLGTEGLRWMGPARMEVGAALRLCAGKKYAGKLAFTNEALPDTLATATAALVQTPAMAAEEPSSDSTRAHPKAETVDSAADSAPTAGSAAVGAAWPRLGAGALACLASRPLTPVASPDYFLWQASQLSVVDPTLLITPNARGWSGTFHMAWVSEKGCVEPRAALRASKTENAMLRVFIDMNSVRPQVAGADFQRLAAVRTMGLMELGAHLGEPAFQVVEVTGFVLEPDPNAKYMSVDGEAVRTHP